MSADAAAAERVGGTVQLRYVARAGLLPELSRQTYDSLWKAIREAILNSVDADARHIELDLSGVVDRRELVVSDDGVGMSTKEFCEHFMSLGGSAKFRDAERFGRIGIGSLALLQYADTAVIETKRAGSEMMMRARISHAWDLGRSDRHAHLEDLAAGTAEEVRYDGDHDDHFTRVRLVGVSDEVAAVGADPTAFYALVERLRRVLPLPWSDGPLTDALRRRAPELVAALVGHANAWSAPVVVHSPWERDVVLTRRAFGDDQMGSERWSGPPLPILKSLRVPSGSLRRRITVAGFLLNQQRATAAWMGLTARVQNVAVEEHTFFDVTADPGFRKYISGEIWLFGDLDRERLINIDRASFNRECVDYQVVQRYLARAIVDFKSAGVQRPQRAKVAVRRRIQERIDTIDAIERVVGAVAELHDADDLPASESSRRAPSRVQTLAQELREEGAIVAVCDAETLPKGGFALGISDDGTAVKVHLDSRLETPSVAVGSNVYALEFAAAGASGPPIVIRGRPRRIVVNVEHPAHVGASAPTKIQMGLALELAFLLGDGRDAAQVYERMLAFLEAL